MSFKRVTGIRSPIQRQQLASQGSLESLRLYEDLQSAIASLDIARASAETAARNADATAKRVMEHALKIQKGDKGDMPSPQDVFPLLKDYIPAPIKGNKGDKGETGEPGYTPIKGIDYRDGIDGVAPSSEEIAKIIAPLIPDAVDHESIVEKVFKLFKEKKKLHVDDLEGFEQTIGPIRSLAAGFRGGGDTVEAGSNITITTVDGKKRIASTGGAGATFYTETPTGAIDGVNQAYTVLHSITSIVNISINGIYIHPADYSVSGSTITFITALDASLSGLPFTVTYT